MDWNICRLMWIQVAKTMDEMEPRKNSMSYKILGVS